MKDKRGLEFGAGGVFMGERNRYVGENERQTAGDMQAIWALCSAT